MTDILDRDKPAPVELPLLTGRQLLRRNQYFSGLSDEHLDRVETLLKRQEYGRDEFIYAEGDDNSYLYLVASGAVKVFGTSADGKEQIITLARSGDSFNDVAAFDGRPTPASAQAMTPVVLYRLSGPELLSRSCQYGPLAANIIEALGKKVRELGDLVADLSFRPVSGRLARILLQQLPYTDSARLTQRDMASMAGTAREVIARALRSLEEQGMIKVDRQQIVILDREALERLAA